MKKLTYILALLLLFSVTGSSYAQEATTSGRTLIAPRETVRRENLIASSGAVKTQIQANEMTNLRERAQQEVTRRITALNMLSKRIGEMKKLSSVQKTQFQGEIQAQIDGLNSTLAKINSDTDITTLRADVKSIITEYYIFAFFNVKISLLVATDRISTATDTVTMIYNKLQDRVTKAKAEGKDVTEMQANLTDMLAKINDAKTQYTLAENELNSLTVQGYPANKTSLLDARAKIKSGEAALKTALEDGRKVIQELKASGTTLPSNHEPSEASQSSKNL